MNPTDQRALEIARALVTASLESPETHGDTAEWALEEMDKMEQGDLVMLLALSHIAGSLVLDLAHYGGEEPREVMRKVALSLVERESQ